MKSRYRLAGLGLALMLSACAAAPPDIPDRATLATKLTPAAGTPNEADNTPGDVDTLGGAITEALRSNPALRSEYARVEALLLDVPQVSSLADPMLSVSQREPVRGPGDERENMLTVSQTFPWFGKRELRGRAAREEALAALEQYRLAALELRQAVIRSWHSLRFEEDFRQLLLEEQALLEESAAATASLYQSGRRDRGALLRAQTELAIVENELPANEASIEGLRRELGRLMALPNGVYTDRPLPDPYSAEPDMPPERDALIAAAMEHRPELERHRRMVERARLREELARADYYPDVTAGLGVGGMGSRSGNFYAPTSDGRTDSITASIGINLPIPNARRRAAEEQARRQGQEASFLREESGNAIMEEIHSLRAAAAALHRQHGLYQNTILPLAEESHLAAEAAYRSGQNSYVDLLDAQRTLLSARREMLRIERDYRLVLADLEKAAGIPLDLLAHDEVTQR